MKAADCEYKEYDRRQFIHGLDDDVIIEEITRELTASKDACEVTSDQVLMWAQSVEAQTAQKRCWTT